jgi:c-di-GMP-binding flagellar brake protein YcgR
MVKMTDLSGGGFAFVTDRTLSANDTVVVTAASPKLSLAGVKAKIIGAAANRASARMLYHAQFINIDFAKRELIIKYVFSRLRELNQR